MKITNQVLRQIIKEELENVLSETNENDEYESPLLKNVPKVSGRRDVTGEYDPKQIAKHGQGKNVFQGTSLVDAVDQDPRVPENLKEKIKNLLNGDEESQAQAMALMDALDIQHPIYSSDNEPFALGRDGFDDEPYIHRIHMSPSEEERYEMYSMMGSRGQKRIRDEEAMKRYVGKKGPKKQFHPELDPTHPSRKFGRFELDPSEVPRITDDQIEQMKKERLRKSVRKDMDYNKRLKK